MAHALLRAQVTMRHHQPALPLTYAPAPARPASPSPPRKARAERRRWSFHLGRLFGIELRVHFTFLLLLAWIGMSSWLQSHDTALVIEGVVYVICVFAIVVLHELGHALTARRFGIPTRDITLLPIGGVSRLEHMPTVPSQELLVAVAGPAVNIVLAAVLFGVVLLMGKSGGDGVSRLSLVGGPFVAKLVWTNLALAVFNLVPAFPMDGGRVLRAIVATRTDRVKATDIAAAVGKVIAIAFGILGTIYNPLLVFIALFVWAGAQEEARMEHVKASLSGLAVHDAMIPLDGDLTTEARVAPEVPVVREGDSLETALTVLQQSGRRNVPVVRDGHLVGMLPMENVAAMLQLRERNRQALAQEQEEQDR
jgi:Zn-dependent protease